VPPGPSLLMRNLRLSPYLHPMVKTCEFCIPTIGKAVPSAPEWLHEIKYDGYRRRVEREGDRVTCLKSACTRIQVPLDCCRTAGD
jgi:hypothetical protein